MPRVVNKKKKPITKKRVTRGRKPKLVDEKKFEVVKREQAILDENSLVKKAKEFLKKIEADKEILGVIDIMKLMSKIADGSEKHEGLGATLETRFVVLKELHKMHLNYLKIVTQGEGAEKELKRLKEIADNKDKEYSPVFLKQINNTITPVSKKPETQNNIELISDIIETNKKRPLIEAIKKQEQMLDILDTQRERIEKIDSGVNVFGFREM